VIGIGFVIGAIFKRKTQMLRHKLDVIFLVRKDISASQMIEMSSTAMIILYKKNLIKRNKATLKFWERRREPKFFFSVEDSEKMNLLIKLANDIKITSSLVKLKDNSPALLAVGPMGEKRKKKMTEGLKLIE
jgi:peptidyl-tRNA hydrolase